MENRGGLVVDAETARVSGQAERLATLKRIAGMDASGARRITLDADMGYETRDLLEVLPHRGATPNSLRTRTAAARAIA
jgi:hypothetical protein